MINVKNARQITAVFAIFFILCVNRSALAAVALGKAQEHPNNPGKCYDPLTNVSKNVGAKWPLKNGCGRIMCEKLGNSLYLSYSTCPSIAGGVEPSCRVVSGDNKAPFPDCCPRIKCPSVIDLTEKNLSENEINTDGQPEIIATYDVTLNDQDYSDNYDTGFSDVFPLWRDIRDSSNVGIDDEEKPDFFSPRK